MKNKRIKIEKLNFGYTYKIGEISGILYCILVS